MGRDKHHRQGKQPKRYMLDMGRVDKFKYQAKQVIEEADVDDRHVNSVTTTLFSKATSQGTDAAKEWLQGKAEDGDLPDDLCDDLLHLLDKYSRWR